MMNIINAWFYIHVYKDDEKPPPGLASVNMVPVTAPPAKPAPHALFLDKLQELNTSGYDYPA